MRTDFLAQRIESAIGDACQATGTALKKTGAVLKSLPANVCDAYSRTRASSSWRGAAFGVFASVLTLPMMVGAAAERPADLILQNGAIHALDATDAVHQAVAIRDGVIVAAGSNSAIEHLRGAGTTKIDLKGRLVLPGLTESHAHLFNTGLTKVQLDLRAAKSFDDVVELVRARVKTAKKGEWIIGSGWDQNNWNDKTLPSHERISALTPDNPVSLTRVDYHTFLVNEATMKLAGITADTKDPEGGKIIRDAAGKPTGVLLDKACDSVSALIPPLTLADTKKAIEAGIGEAVRFGFTSFTDAYVRPGEMTVLEQMANDGALPIRIYAMLAADYPELIDTYFTKGPQIRVGRDHHLTVRAAKLLADGGLGARSAALLHPYADDPSNSGILRVSEDQTYALAVRGLRAGFQVAIHGVGDRTNRTIINAYERALATVKDGNERRFRIEHGSLIATTDVPRMARLGIMAAVQPLFCRTQCPYVAKRVGQTTAEAEAFVFRSLLDSGVHVLASSDSPVESMDPFQAMYAAVTRRGADGKPDEGWFPRQKLTLEQVVKAYTREGAYGTFEEHDKGTIEVGKLADLTVLSTNPFVEGVEALLSTRADYTIVGGKVVFHRE